MMMVIGDQAIFLRAVSYTVSNPVNLLLSSPVPSVDGKTSESIHHSPAWRGEYRGNLANAGKAGE